MARYAFGKTRVRDALLRPAPVTTSPFALPMSFDELIIAFFLAGFGTQTLPVKMDDSIVVEISPVLSAISVLLTVLAMVICVTVTALHKTRADRDAAPA